jgi:hypothetical protein
LVKSVICAECGGYKSKWEYERDINIFDISKSIKGVYFAVVTDI